MSTKGEIWNQNLARKYSQELSRIVLICGHYEGFDERIQNLIDEEIAIGQYVLSGGELPAMIITDSLVRLLDGALGSPESAIDETFSDEELKHKEYPQYTRPEVFITDEGEEWKTPEILLSGNHAEIEKWKKEGSK
jgi:tRNA (guanine37-N1)-methyltransferase